MTTFRRFSNVEFVTDLITRSEFGDLAAIFLIEALVAYSDAVLNSPIIPDPEALVDPESWHGVAAEFKGKLIERFSKETPK